MTVSDIVAILALIGSGLALWQARRSANAAYKSADAAERSAVSAEQISKIDAARHLEERRPSWDVQLERGRGGYVGPPKLLLRLTSTETVEHVEVVSLVAQKLTFRGDQEGCDLPGDTAVSVRPIHQGRDAAWHVQTPQPPEGGTARLEVRSAIGEAEWSNVFEVKLPAAPPRVYSF